MNRLERNIQLRRMRSAEWTNKNPVLLPGEPGYALDTEELKIGDGLSNWANLTAIGYVQSYWANVLDYGAKADGVTDDAAAIQAAIATGDVVYLPPGTYKVKSTLSCSLDGLQIIGAGWSHTIIDFNPSANDVLFDFESNPTGSELWRVSLENLKLTMTAGYTNTAIKVTDISTSYFKNIYVYSWTGKGLQIQGRELTTFKNCIFQATQPVSIEKNPNYPNIDIDNFHFEDIHYLNTSSTGACVTLADGVNLTFVTFDGIQSGALGKYWMYWSDTTTTAISQNLRISGLKWEQPETSSGYGIYIARNNPLVDLMVENTSLSAGDGGIYLRNIRDCKMNGVLFHQLTGQIALNIDETVKPFELYGCSILDAASMYVGNLVEKVYVKGYSYKADYALYGTDDQPLDEREYRIFGTSIWTYSGALGDDATLTIPGYYKNMAQIIVAADNGAGVAEGGHFVVTSSDGNNQSTKLSGSANSTTSDTDENLCIYKNVGTASILIKNRLGSTVNLQVIVYWE